MKFDFKKLLLFILVPLSLGALVGLLTSSNSNVNSIIPPWIFPIVWTILYILMGISSYLVYDTIDYNKPCCLIIYAVSLFINFLWSPIFFGLELRLFALIWIILLDIVVIYMILCFYKVNKKAAYLNIPYLLWCLFATYLNYSIYILNR